MPRKLIDQLARPRFPDADAAVPAAHPDPLTFPIPTRPHQIPLHAHRCSSKGPQTPVDGRKRPDIPRPRQAVVRIAQQALRVGRDGEGGDGVGVTGHAVRDGLLPDVVGEDVAVDAAGVDFVPGLGDRDARDGEIRLDEVDRPFDPRVPHPDAPVVGPGDEHLLPARRRRQAVDNLLVAFVPADPQARLQVPRRQRRVRGRGEDVVRGAGPVQVEDGAFVAVEDAVVFAGAVGAPEHDGAVHGARGYQMARRIEAGGEDFAGVAWWDGFQSSVHGCDLI